MDYKYNGLKSPLWSGLHNPLFSPFEGSSLAGGGASVPANAIKDRADDPILDRAGAYIEQRA